MTNLDKFIEVMNDTFNAGFTKENMVLICSPCGSLKRYQYACEKYKCEECNNWWHKEYKKEVNDGK